MDGTRLLSGRRALVTGAANPRGIGYAIAHQLAAAGSAVVSLDVAVPEPGQTRTWPVLLCDVADAARCRSAVNEAAAQMGGLDLVVNNAGIVGAAPLEDLTEADFRRMLDVNLMGAIHITQAALAHLRAPSAIVNVASMAAYRGGGLLGGAHYATSKGGLISFTRACARELGPRGIRVNAVAPGIIDTDVTIGKFGEHWEQQLKASVPLGRFGAPGEVASVVVFLASTLAGYVNGAVVDVNGGIYMH